MAEQTLADIGATVYPPAPPAGGFGAAPPKRDFLADNARLIDEQNAAQADLEQRRQTEQEPLRQQAATANTALSDAVAAPVQKVPVPQQAQAPRHMDPKVLNDTASMIMTLGAFMGLTSRQPFTAALKNMTGAMEGSIKGDQMQFDRATQEFNAAFNHAITQNRQLMVEREAVIRDKNLDLTAKNNALHLLDVKYDTQLKNLNMPFVARMKSNDAQQRVVEHTEAVAQQFQNQLSLERQRQLDRVALLGAKSSAAAAGVAAIPQSTVDFYARQSLSGDSSWQVGLARGKVGQALIAAVKDRIPQMAAENNMTPQDASATKGQRDAINKALGDRQKYVAAANQFIRNFQLQADLVDKYIEPGVGGATPVFNRWIQAGRVKVAGDEDVTRLDTAIRGLAREHQRIVTGVTSNAQLHVSAQQTADELANKDMTAGQIRATLGVMREEAKNALETGNQEVAFQTDLLRHLGPQVPGVAKPSGGASPTEPPPTNAKGWRLHKDAKGNMAYVGPNNEVEEVK